MGNEVHVRFFVEIMGTPAAECDNVISFVFSACTQQRVRFRSRAVTI